LSKDTTGRSPMTHGKHDLVVVTTPEEWDAYHSIRRTELFEARGRIYDPNDPDEFAATHFPLLLKWSGIGIGTTRLDIHSADVGIVRLVAIMKSEQGKGHGRILAVRTEAFARERGIRKLFVNAAANAVGFYERIGFRPASWDASELVGWNSDSVQMAKSLS